MPRDLSPILPESIDVWYVARQCSGLCSDTPDFYFPKTYVSTVHLSSVAFTDPGINPRPLGVPGTTRTIRDTAHALFTTAAGTPSNLAALTNLSNRIARDLYDWASVNADVVLNGINVVTPCGINDVI